MSTEVYVVMAGEGDVSGHSEWVCGVFADAETAKAIVIRKQAEADALWSQFPAWQERRDKSYGPGGWSATAWDAFVAVDPPPLPEAERFWVLVVPMETWGKWEDEWFMSKVAP